VPTQIPRTTATFEGPSRGGRGQRTSAPKAQQTKVGVQSHVVQIRKDEIDLLKLELKKAQCLICQKQNKLEHKKSRAFTHQQQLQDQLNTAIVREDRATEERRQIQVTLDQAKFDLHTVQNKKSQLELQKQHKLNILRDAAELVRVHLEKQQQQQIGQIQQTADQQTALAKNTRDEAAQQLLDAQAIKDIVVQTETAAQALRDQAVIDQQAANQARLAAQQQTA